MGWRYPGQDFAARLPDGSAAIPSLSFAGNPDSGLYYDAANNRIALAYDGVDVTRFDAGGLTTPSTASIVANGVLNAQSAFRLAPETTKTATPYNATATDAVIVMNAGAGQICNLPANPANSQAVFIRGHANALTVGRNGKNINGAAADLVVGANTAVVLVYNGTDWWVVG